MNPTGPTVTPTGAEVCALSTVRVGSLAGRRRDRNSPRSPTCIHLLCLVCQTYSTCSLLWSPEWNEDPANAPDEDSEAQIQRLDNSIIHLVSNCADTLVCRLCQPATNHNRLVTRRDP